MSYRIDPRPPLTSEVQRIAAEEIGEALRHLAARRATIPTRPCMNAASG